MPMSTMRSVSGGSLYEMLHPPCRKVNFHDSKSVTTISSLLRMAWLLKPLPDQDFNDLFGQKAQMAELFRHIQRLSKEQYEEERYRDKDDVHTPLRDCIYKYYNHVFDDIVKYLREIGPSIGHLHPPNHHFVAIQYPDKPIPDNVMVDVLDMSFDYPTIFLPAFMDPGAKVKFSVSRAPEETSSPTGAHVSKPAPTQRETPDSTLTLDASDLPDGGYFRNYEAMWVAAGSTLKVSLGGVGIADRKGVASMLVYGILCTRRPSNPDHDGITGGGDGPSGIFSPT